MSNDPYAELRCPAHLLRRAGEKLALRGWQQGDLVDDAGRLCLVGALRSAADVHPHEEPTALPVRRALWDAQIELARAVADDPAASFDADTALETVARWNDRPGRTASQALALLEAVADDLDDGPARRQPDPATLAALLTEAGRR